MVALDTFKTVPKWVWIAGAAGVALILIKKAAPNVVPNATAGVVGLAADIAKGAVLGVGDLMGVPRTDEEKCRACIAAADNYGASKYCSAGVFAKWQLLSTRKKMTGKTFTMSDIFSS